MTISEPPRPSPIAPGYQLDRYEMLCPIAEGGMASVWVARLRGKRGFEKLVAIKTILPKFAQDPRFERMFLDEAGLAARIEHANVTQVLDLGEEHNVLYLAMELIDGDALSKLLGVVTKKGQKIPPGVVLRILADTCGGLHAAHEVRGADGGLLNVVHRDVSPQNILVTMHGVAKLIDFGIAKARDRVSEDTSEGQLKGKIHYMAPEQALGKADRRADIFAVGSIIYFLLAGKPPFAGDSELATLFNLSSGRPPAALPPEIHPSVNAVVMKALAHKVDDRFASALEMQQALEAAMVEASLVTTTANVGAFVQEHMAARAKRRKEGLDLALSAAAQRGKVAKMLERVGADTPSGHGLPSDSSGPVSSIEATYATVLLGNRAAPLRTQGWASAPPTLQDEVLEPTKGLEPTSDVLDVGPPRKKLGWVVGGVLAAIAVPVIIALVARPKTSNATAEAPGASVLAKAASPQASAPMASPQPADTASSAASATVDAGFWEVPSATAATAVAKTVPFSSLPPAVTKPPTTRPRAPAPAPAPAPASPPQGKHRVNDGF